MDDKIFSCLQQRRWLRFPIFVHCLLWTYQIQFGFGFVPKHPSILIRTTTGSSTSSSFFRLYGSTSNSSTNGKNKSNDDHSEGYENIETEQDWRAFRAKLVMQETAEAAAAGVTTTSSTTAEKSSSLFVVNDEKALMGSNTSSSDFNESTFLSSSSSSSTANTMAMESTDPTTWAYDTGLLIEKGSIIISRIEPTLGCHDIQQPYFCKCVILIVDQQEDGTNHGIILNRPSDLLLRDEDIVYDDNDNDGEDIYDDDDTVSPGSTLFNKNKNKNKRNNKNKDNNSWQLFFGGDIGGIYDDDPLIVCLHNLTSSSMTNKQQHHDALEVSDMILPGIYMTSHLAARQLVDDNNYHDDDDDYDELDVGDNHDEVSSQPKSVGSSSISSNDFFTFSGFAVWTSGQLEEEVQRGSWYVMNMDSKTIWNELITLRNPETYNPKSAGIDMWYNLISKMIPSSANQEQQKIQQDYHQQDDSPQEEQKYEKYQKEIVLGQIHTFPELMLKEWASEMLLLAKDDQSYYQQTEQELQEHPEQYDDENNNADSYNDIENNHYIENSIQTTDEDILWVLQQQKQNQFSMATTTATDSCSNGIVRPGRLFIARESKQSGGGRGNNDTENHEDDDDDNNIGVSPFLLHGQFLHKSILLSLQESDTFSIGIVLNLPTSNIYQLTLPKSKQVVEFVVRYGGPGTGTSSEYENENDDDEDDDDADDEEEIFVWLHNNPTLKEHMVGRPLSSTSATILYNNDPDENEGDDSNDDGATTATTTSSISSSNGINGSIWICSLEQVIDAIESGLAWSTDFMLISGFCVWKKEQLQVQQQGQNESVSSLLASLTSMTSSSSSTTTTTTTTSGGLYGQVLSGKFEPLVFTSSSTTTSTTTTTTTSVIDDDTTTKNSNNVNNIDNTNDKISDIWSILTKQTKLSESTLERNIDLSRTAWSIAKRLNNNDANNDDHDDDDDEIVKSARNVFGTNVNVAKFSDQAFEAWVKIFLLGNAEYRV